MDKASASEAEERWFESSRAHHHYLDKPFKMNSSLRIGLISYRSNPYCGGQGVYIRHLSKALSDLGHSVEIISGPPTPILDPGNKLTMLPTLDLYNPEDLFRTPTPRELKNPVNIIEWLGVSTMGYPEPMTFGMRANGYLRGREDRYDIIHDNQSLSYSMLSIARRVPVCATIHHPITVDRKIAVQSTRSYFKKLKHLRWYSFIGMQKYVARRLPRILTVSEFSKKDIAKEFNINENRFTSVPIGINTRHFHPLDHIRRERGRIIVTNSADTPLKGLYHLLWAMKSVLRKRYMKLVVIGTPKKKGGIEKLVKKLDLKNHITFTGRIDHDRFLQEYARGSIAVVPSLYEGFGLPAGEAMACGTPLICTTGGALPEVAGNAAKLVPPGNAKALEEAIIELLDDSAKRDTLARAGYERITSEFTWENTALNTVNAYKEVMDDYNRP